MNRNRWVGNGIKRKNTELAAFAAMALRPILVPVRIEIKWIERDKRRDLDNVSFAIKFILDGIVEAGKLPNDTREFVTGINHIFPDPDKINPRIEVFLIPLDQLKA